MKCSKCNCKIPKNTPYWEIYNTKYCINPNCYEPALEKKNLCDKLKENKGDTNDYANNRKSHT